MGPYARHDLYDYGKSFETISEVSHLWYSQDKYTNVCLCNLIQSYPHAKVFSSLPQTHVSHLTSRRETLNGVITTRKGLMFIQTFDILVACELNIFPSTTKMVSIYPWSTTNRHPLQESVKNILIVKKAGQIDGNVETKLIPCSPLHGAPTEPCKYACRVH